MAMAKDLLVAVDGIFDMLRRSFWPLFLTSIFYRVIAFTLLAPLVSGIARLLFKGSGRLVVANEEIAAFFLEPIGFFALLVIAACSLTLIALEQACLMALLFEADTGNIYRVWSAVRHALTRSARILELAARIVIHVLLYSTPFVIGTGLLYYALLTAHDINYYLTVQPPEFQFAIIGGLLLALGLVVTLIAVVAFGAIGYIVGISSRKGSTGKPEEQPAATQAAPAEDQVVLAPADPEPVVVETPDDLSTMVFEDEDREVVPPGPPLVENPMQSRSPRSACPTIQYHLVSQMSGQSGSTGDGGMATALAAAIIKATDEPITEEEELLNRETIREMNILGVIKEDERMIAMVSGKEVKEGDKFRQFTVETITRDHIVFSFKRTLYRKLVR